jgi:hypothetical protein
MHHEIQLIPNNTLLTSTPEEGKELAIKMALLIMKHFQPNDLVNSVQLKDIKNDVNMLISISQIVATEYATIAAAKNYWK